ncbi:hypothetical protein BC826DRAFT_1103050 [Russula brevipes]|nr:hypothetical protein BC826DRAFT_1103050 [Russula brevipes]
MNLIFLYFLTAFVLNNCHVFAQIDMTLSGKVLGAVVGALVGAERRVENAADSVSDALGDKLFGPTAESELKNAVAVAPEATTEPTTVGRRSKRPDGQDPFHSASTTCEDKDKA